MINEKEDYKHQITKNKKGKNVMKRKMKRLLVCFLVLVMCIAGSATAVFAVTSNLDVTVRGGSGAISPDPYSIATVKDDGEQYFYVRITSLTGGNNIQVTAYDYETKKSVSNSYTITSSQVGQTIKIPYTVTASAGKKYYLHTATSNYTEVHAVGYYTP